MQSPPRGGTGLDAARFRRQTDEIVKLDMLDAKGPRDSELLLALKHLKLLVMHEASYA